MPYQILEDHLFKSQIAVLVKLSDCYHEERSLPLPCVFQQVVFDI